MSRPLAVGDVIHWFARGAFGRDHYDCVKIEAAGLDWIVARGAKGGPSFAAGRKSLTLLIEVRDEDPCGNPDGCPLGQDGPQLTVPGGW